ncbi:hypothetical protein M9Y10_021906 [Tritrichomonas musculus]|uniref:Uncharacterized protein n=1 Tax=Tritrichomonas musculus TaxID=1915356 RepID=A0ABR2KQR0_9EUKA
MYTLNIYLSSIELKKDLVQENDKIEIHVTTVPDINKQSIVIAANEMKNLSKSFKLNITNQLKEILFVFKKNNSQEKQPIFASLVASVLGENVGFEVKIIQF